MTDTDRVPVRPTKRCLDDLGLGFPPLEQPLKSLHHPVVSKAQQIPEEVQAQGAERILAIKDRVWFKVKVGTDRAAVTELDRATESCPEIIRTHAWWWIGAAGKRKQDSSTDFYASLKAECERAGKRTGSTSSTHLLPAHIDLQRLEGELAVQAVLGIKRTVCGLVARSIRDGKMWSGVLSNHKISAVVQAQDGGAYLAVSAEGFIDPRLLAIILRSVPGVPAEDWLPEPEGAFGIEPKPGEILYSTIIPPEFQSKLVDDFLGED